MTNDQFEVWAERKRAVFEQWVFAYFVPCGRNSYKARKVRSVAAWRGVMAETPYVFNQADNTRTFSLHAEDFSTVGRELENLFVFFRFTAPDGQQYEPTEGMVVNTTTGEMSYV